MQVIAKQGQSLIDIALQYAGDATAVFAIAQANNLSITDDLTIGSTLEMPVIENVRVSKFFNDEKTIPATAVTESQLFKPEGIDFWGVEDDFIVQQD